MSYCLNPKCPKPADPLNAQNRMCRHCGSLLLVHGRYQVRHLLGEGGFGKTFEVNDQGQVKVLKVLLDSNPKAVSLFQREAQVLSQLNHPGIPRVERDGYFTFWPRESKQPLHCLVMERIEGRNLEEWMSDRHNHPIPQHQALNWLQQLADILDRVHRQQYFHRDIKPSNIMLQPNGQLALIDFGSAREVTGTYLAKVGGGHKITGIVSPGYTPPEQANGKAVPQSDFYALGRTFVFLLTGKHPNDFSEDIRTGELKWRDMTVLVSKPLANLLDYMMAPFPGNRPHNTQVILQRLEEIASEEIEPRSQSVQPQPPQAIGTFPPYASSATVPPALQTFNSTKRFSRRSRWKHKKVKVAQRFLSSGFILLFMGIAAEIFGVFQWPEFSALLSLGTPSKAILSEAAAQPDLDGKLVSLGNLPPTEQKNMTLVKTLAGHLRGVNSVAIGPNVNFVASASVDKTVKLWNLATGEVMHSLSGHSQEIWSVAISPDGTTVASGSGDGTIKLWDASSGQLLHTLSDHAAWVLAVAFSPDGKILASGGLDNTIKLWQVATGQLIGTLSGHSGWVFSLAFSPDGQSLASGSFDNTIKIWRMP